LLISLLLLLLLLHPMLEGGMLASFAKVGGLHDGDIVRVR
jgi:hypothetical protein